MNPRHLRCSLAISVPTVFLYFISEELTHETVGYCSSQNDSCRHGCRQEEWARLLLAKKNRLDSYWSAGAGQLWSYKPVLLLHMFARIILRIFLPIYLL